jgi:hypothetical protein
MKKILPRIGTYFSKEKTFAMTKPARRKKRVSINKFGVKVKY